MKVVASGWKQEATPGVIQFIHVPKELVVDVNGAGIASSDGDEGFRLAAAEAEAAERRLRLLEFLERVLDLGGLFRPYRDFGGVILIPGIPERDLHFSG